MVCTTLSMHDIHISNTIVNYDSESRTIQVSTRMFLDDLELDLISEGYKDLKLCTPYEADNGDQAVAEYILNNLYIISEKDTIALNYLGKEISDDYMAAWCYLESEEMNMPHSLQFEIHYMLDIYDDQKNMVAFKKDNQRIQGEILDSKTTNVQINL